MSSVKTMSADAGGNVDLQAMHRDLVALVRRLEASIDAAPNATAVAAIIEQMGEVDARVTSVGRVLFAAQTDEIGRRAKAVSEAIPAIEEEIEDVQRCERTVRNVTALLGVVDEVVSIAARGLG